MMKTFVVSIALLGFSAPVFAEPAESIATAEIEAGTIIDVQVNGMVCDFCAQAVTKVFGREDAVDSVVVNLDDGAITLSMKPGMTLDDDRISDLVRQSGYALVEINRGDA